MSAPDWDAIRKDAESGSVTSWNELARKYGVPRKTLAEKREQDAAAGDPWKPKWARKTVAPASAHADAHTDASAPARDTSNVLNFPQDRTPSKAAGSPHFPRSDNARGEQRAGGAIQRPKVATGDGFIEAVPLVDFAGAESILDGIEDMATDPLASHERIAKLLGAVQEGMLRLLLRGMIQPGQHQSMADVADKTIAAVDRASKLQRIFAGKKDGDASGVVAGGDAPIEVITRRLDPVKIPVDARGRALPKSEAS